MTPDTLPRLLLVHGAWVGPWEFGPLVEILRGRGWQVETVALPSTGSTRGIEDDARAVTAAIEAAPGRVVLVGHSYGGVPISLSGDHTQVDRLVYVAAFALDEGESVKTTMGDQTDWWGIQDGQVTMGHTRAERVAMIAADMPPEAAPVAEGLADLFLPQSYRSLTETVSCPAWRAKPTTFVLAQNDGIVPPPLQEHLAARTGGDIVRVAHGHAPFQEDPVSFAELLERIALGTPESL